MFQCAFVLAQIFFSTKMGRNHRKNKGFPYKKDPHTPTVLQPQRCKLALRIF